MMHSLVVTYVLQTVLHDQYPFKCFPVNQTFPLDSIPHLFLDVY